MLAERIEVAVIEFANDDHRRKISRLRKLQRLKKAAGAEKSIAADARSAGVGHGLLSRFRLA